MFYFIYKRYLHLYKGGQYTPSEHFIRYLFIRDLFLRLIGLIAAVVDPLKRCDALSFPRCSSAHHCCNVWLFALLSPSCQLWLPRLAPTIILWSKSLRSRFFPILTLGLKNSAAACAWAFSFCHTIGWLNIRRNKPSTGLPKKCSVSVYITQYTWMTKQVTYNNVILQRMSFFFMFTVFWRLC